jgi:hypothetical protein
VLYLDFALSASMAAVGNETRTQCFFLSCVDEGFGRRDQVNFFLRQWRADDDARLFCFPCADGGFGRRDQVSFS